MGLVHRDSLAGTIDAVNEAFFYGRRLSKSDRQQAAKWIAGRQGKPGSYADMFAPTEADFKRGVRLFAGETIRTRAGTAHILGEEACRALILLDVSLASVREALSRASAGMMARLGKARELASGTYCCGRCSVSLWRHLAAGGLEEVGPERLLTAGMKTLKSHRQGNGRWKRFGFYYPLLALSEIELPSAIREMRYAAPACERYLQRPPKDEQIDQRRRLLAERVLSKC